MILDLFNWAQNFTMILDLLNWTRNLLQLFEIYLTELGSSCESCYFNGSYATWLVTCDFGHRVNPVKYQPPNDHSTTSIQLD